MQSRIHVHNPVEPLVPGIADAQIRRMMFTTIAFSMTLFLVNAGGDTMNNRNDSSPPARPFHLGVPAEDACGAASLSHLIGQPVPDETALAAIEGPKRIRVIAPGDAVTMDYQPWRLNIETDADGIVQRLRCG